MQNNNLGSSLLKAGGVLYLVEGVLAILACILVVIVASTIGISSLAGSTGAILGIALGGVFVVVGLAGLFQCVLYIVAGVLFFRWCDRPEKQLTLWSLSLVLLIFSVLEALVSLVDGSALALLVVIPPALAFAGAMVKRRNP